MKITRIRGSDADSVASAVQSSLSAKGYDVMVEPKTSTSVSIRKVRLGKPILETSGYNISPYTNRRGRVLGWRNWVEVNNTINETLDRMNVSANASSLGGRFKVREGKTAFTEDDWEDLKYENVGSVVNPLKRVDAWASEGKPAIKKKLDKVV